VDPAVAKGGYQHDLDSGRFLIGARRGDPHAAGNFGLGLAFYHWFVSKDALITALAERSARDQFTVVENAVAKCRGSALDRLNALLGAGFDVKMRMGTPEQLAAMVSLLRPANAHRTAESSRPAKISPGRY
jgi:hypothetical protein